jgi:ABC-type transport system involved in multi-copper enzyme maturation permease subunit
VTAATHTEIYRPFRGALAPSRWAFWPLYRAQMAIATKRKLPLFILFFGPAMTGIVVSFLAYMSFQLEETGTGGPLLSGGGLAAQFAAQLLKVHELIVNAMKTVRFFAVLAMAWYGAGLICDDRRAGAHLLYFSRPLTRFDYLLAHFATAFSFGSLAGLGPGLLICIVATFNSPDFIFLTEKWPVIVATIGYSLLFVTVMSALILAVSALSKRKSYALAAVFAVFMSTLALGGALSALMRERQWWMLSIASHFERVAAWWLGASRSMYRWDPWWSLGALAALTVISFAIVAWRVRRMEVVG